MRHCCRAVVAIVIVGVLAASPRCVAAAEAGETVAHGSRVMAAADHPVIATTGAFVLRAGGNAADAAVAMAFAVGVARPASAGIGGGCFIVAKAAGSPAITIDGRETAPAGVTLSAYLDQGKANSNSRLGPWSVGVPGLVAALHYLWKTEGSGKLSWAELIEPAAKLAVDGVALDDHNLRALNILRYRMAGSGQAPELCAETEQTYVAETVIDEETGKLVWRQPELARIMRTLAKQGPGYLYGGALGQAIVEAVQAHGGPLSLDDLNGYRVAVRKPVQAKIGAHRFHSMGPPSSGGAVVLALTRALHARMNTAAGAGARKWDELLAPDTAHFAIECMKHTFADRAAGFGDGDDATHGPTVHKAVATMVSADYAEYLLAHIDGQRTRPAAAYGHHRVGDDDGTSHLSVIDGQGNAVALTMTVNHTFGSLMTVQGVVLNNELDDFTFAAGQANAFGLVQSARNLIRPGRRPLSSMTPLIVTDLEDRVVLVLGAAGGPRIITATWQVTMHRLVFGAGLEQAMRAPRFHHQWQPNVVYVEGGVGDEVRASLQRRGHELKPYASHAGYVNAVGVDYGEGIRVLTGVGSTRKGGGAAGF